MAGNGGASAGAARDEDWKICDLLKVFSDFPLTNRKKWGNMVRIKVTVG
jgi:hypothetical protein